MSTDRTTTPLKQYPLVLGGAIIGGALGVALTWFLAKQGLLAGAAPGGLLGLGAGLAWHRALWIPILCAIAALSLGVFTEWWLFPFRDDKSFYFFIQNLHNLPFSTQFMIAIGGAVGFWGPYRAMRAKGPRG